MRNIITLTKLILILIIINMILLTMTMQISGAQTDIIQEKPSETRYNITGQILVSDDEPMEDDAISVHCILKNNESVDISNITVIFQIDGEEIGNISGLSIQGNASLDVECNWTAEKDTHTITIYAMEKNNNLLDTQLTKKITVEPKPLGDYFTPIVLLAVFLFLVLIACIFPSVVERFHK